MSKTISEDVLRGIAEALQAYAPHLLPKVYELMRGGTVEGPEGKIGTSIYGKLANTISWEDGDQILKVLEAIEKQHGYQTQFAGRQINWLVLCWRQFSEPKQLPR